MSFSSDIKKKLSEYKLGCQNCYAAEIAGMLRLSGKSRENRIRFNTENKAVAERLNDDLEKAFGFKDRVHYRDGKTYQLLIDDISEAENITEAVSLGVIPFACCRASYIRGAFLGSGSVSNPEKSYHLEFNAKNKQEAENLCNLLKNEGFPSRTTYRKGHYIVYIKECEAIANLLGYIGAGNSALSMFTIQIEKEMRNSINRRVNCENANADKAARASGKHLVAIKKIQKFGKFDKLPEILQEIARLRIEFPEDSLKELGEKTDPPIGKSGVNHRLNRIVSISESL